MFSLLTIVYNFFYLGVVVIDDQPEVTIDDPNFLYQNNDGFQEVKSKKAQKSLQKAAQEAELRKINDQKKKEVICKVWTVNMHVYFVHVGVLLCSFIIYIYILIVYLYKYTRWIVASFIKLSLFNMLTFNYTCF